MKDIDTNIEGVILTPLKKIDVPGGAVYHGMKKSDPGYFGFGEAYFSKVDSGIIKAWKKHNLMTLNLMVCAGKVKFVVYDDRSESASKGLFYEVCLSQDFHCRLTVPPKVWMGFQGQDKNTSTLLNIVDIEHSPDELDRLEILEIKYDWSESL